MMGLTLYSEKPIAKSKFRLHEVRCQRNTVKCAKCGKAIDKGMLEEHMEEMHSKQKCVHCGFEAEKDQFGSHQKSCSLRPIVCDYCEQSITSEKYPDHLESCGNKTRKCMTCTNFVKIKDWKAHEALGDCSHLKPKPKPIPRDNFALPGQEDDDVTQVMNRFSYSRNVERRNGQENKSVNPPSRIMNPQPRYSCIDPRAQIQRNPPRNSSTNATASTTGARAPISRTTHAGKPGGTSSNYPGSQRTANRSIPSGPPVPQSSLLSQTGAHVAKGPSSRTGLTGPSTSAASGSRYAPRSFNKQAGPSAVGGGSVKTAKQANYGYPDSGPRAPAVRGPSKNTTSSRQTVPKPQNDDLEMLLQYQAQFDEEEAHKLAMQDYSGNFEAPKPEAEFKVPEPPKPRYPGIPQESEFAAPNEYPMAPSAAPGYSGGYAYSYASGPGSEGEINQLPSSQQFMSAAGSAALYDSGYAVAQEDPLLQQALEESLKHGGVTDATLDNDDWKKAIELSKRDK